MKYSRNSNFCGKCDLLLDGKMVAHNIESSLADSIVEALNNYEAFKEALKVAEQALKDILNAADNNQPYNKSELVSNFLGDYNKIADTLHTVNELYS